MEWKESASVVGMGVVSIWLDDVIAIFIKITTRKKEEKNAVRRHSPSRMLSSGYSRSLEGDKNRRVR